MNEPVPFRVPPVTRSSALFSDRHRLAGDHRLVNEALTLGDHTVHRNLFARAHAQTIAHVNRRDRHIMFAISRRVALPLTVPARAGRAEQCSFASAHEVPAPARAAPAP